VIRCVIADDHVLVRQAICEVLNQDPRMQHLGNFGDAREAAEFAIANNADVLILDVAMPGASPFDAAAFAKKTRKSLKVVFLSGYDQDEYVLRAIDAGAHAYVLKAGDTNELKLAIEKAHRGERHIPMMHRFIGNRRASSSDHGLTPRERETLKLLAEGNTVKDIAAMLNRSTKTVEVHKFNLMRKLDLHNQAQIVQFAVMNKVIMLETLQRETRSTSSNLPS
jgi:two-component system response regulator NreC